MLFFFTRMSALTTAVLAVLIIGSLFIRNFWCRYLCPYGALMGLLAWGSPTRVVRNRATCIDCRRCTRVCPAYLPVHAKGRIVSPECSGCLECAAVCPVADTLRLETRGAGKRAWRAASLGVVIVLLFLSIVYFARIGGLWESRVPQSQIRLLLKDIDNPAFTHPGLDAN
jgi:polyferredoxin